MEKLSESSIENPILKIPKSGSMLDSISKYKYIIIGIILLIIVGLIGYYMWKKYKKPIVSNNQPIRKTILKNEEKFNVEDNNLEENFSVEDNNNLEENFEDNNNLEDNNSINLE